MSKPKKLTHLLIDKFHDPGRGLYLMLDELVEAHHPDLRDARIALAWALSWNPDVDGRVKLGAMKRASDLDRELVAYDFVMMLSEKFFTDPLTTKAQRRAVMDHELTHGALKRDADGEPIEDQKGRKVYRLRKHDLEEFSEIVDRHGCYKKDLEVFAHALDRSRAQVGDAFVGFQSLRERLHVAGADVPLDAIIHWTEHQRREADVWARLVRELATHEGITVDPPAHVDAASVAQPA